MTTRAPTPGAPTPAATTAPTVSGDELELVRAALRGLRFGNVVITVHDGAIAQIERTEKLRPPRR